MSKKIWAVGILVLMAALAACDPSDPCTPEDLVAPEHVLPLNYHYIGTDSVQPNFIQPDLLEWSFSPDCVPDHFKILFSPDNEFGIARSGMTNGETTWPLDSFAFPQLGLEPATEYFWTIRAWTDGVNGPESSTHVFFTGPQCASATAAEPPELLEPAPGEVLDQNYATLHYIAGGASPCLPEGYFVDLQTDVSFSGTTLLGEYDIPGTWLMTDELADCTTYYWRVAPIVGGVQGPFSETRAFTIAIDPMCMPYSAQIPDIPYELNLCDPEDLIPPELVDPPQFAMLAPGATGDTVPIPDEFFEWESIGCIPEKYKVHFSSDPDFGWSRLGYTDGQLVWPPSDLVYPQGPFDAATEYYWYVQAWDDGVHGPPSETRIFFTGPSCGAGDPVGAPVILEPSEGEEIPSTSVTLNWEPGEPKCVPPFGYFVDIQTESDFSGTNFLQAAPWASKHTLATIDGLEDCTTYFVRIAMTLDSGGNLGPFSETRSFFTNESGTCMRSYLPEVSALRDLACYQGPNPDIYPIEGYLLAGEIASIVAQNLDQDWWYIENPDAPNICAIPMDGGESIGDTSQVPMWNDPNLGLACITYTNENACTAAGCEWVPQATRAGGGYCTDP